MKLINKNLSEFMELNIDKSIICFGAGKLFQDMFITMDNCFLDKIQCVVDSNLKDEKINCNGNGADAVAYPEKQLAKWAVILEIYQILILKIVSF